MGTKLSDMPLFDIRARSGSPESSQVKCQQQNETLAESMQFAMRWIRRYPGRSARELEKIAGCDPGMIWKVAAQLERRGYVTRKKQGSRSLKIYPT